MSKHFWKIYVLIWIITISAYMIIEYKVRGYFAFGAEILMPALAGGIVPLIKEKRQEKN